MLLVSTFGVSSEAYCPSTLEEPKTQKSQLHLNQFHYLKNKSILKIHLTHIQQPTRKYTSWLVQKQKPKIFQLVFSIIWLFLLWSFVRLSLLFFKTLGVNYKIYHEPFCFKNTIILSKVAILSLIFHKTFKTTVVVAIFHNFAQKLGPGTIWQTNFILGHHYYIIPSHNQISYEILKDFYSRLMKEQIEVGVFFLTKWQNSRICVLL